MKLNENICPDEMKQLNDNNAYWFHLDELDGVHPEDVNWKLDYINGKTYLAFHIGNKKRPVKDEWLQGLLQWKNPMTRAMKDFIFKD